MRCCRWIAHWVIARSLNSPEARFLLTVVLVCGALTCAASAVRQSLLHLRDEHEDSRREILYKCLGFLLLLCAAFVSYK